MSRPVVAIHIFDFAEVLGGWHKIRGTTSKLFVDRPNNFRIYHLMEQDWNILNLQETRENMHYVQPLPRGRWVVVRARSGGNTDSNGHIYSPQGDLLRTVAFGNGIQDIQTTADGQIWVSYFDEGIFGNSALGSLGLACVEEDGTLAFRRRHTCL